MRQKLALTNSFIGMFSKIIVTILGMICTRIFVQQLSIEIRGVDGLIANCLNLLQLSELGIGSAVVYALYQPLVDQNKREIASLMALYKKLFRYIGIIIFMLGIVMSFFLQYVISDTTLSWNKILLFYYLQLLGVVITYFVGAYKRNLLYADQKQYIPTAVDMFISILGTVAKIVSLYYFHSYEVYLFLQIIQNVISNILINQMCKKIYPYLNDMDIEKYDKVTQLIDNVKNIFIGKLGNFIYGSTDNLIISRLLGVIYVGYIANYHSVLQAIKILVSSITAPIQPMIGNFIREENDLEKSYDLFINYTFIRYCMANVVTVGCVVAINPLIEVWLGEQYVLSIMVPILLAADLFISMVHGPTGEYITVLGLFKNDRDMSLIGMAINLITSVLFVYKLGLVGVLLGTVLTQIYYWIARTYIVFRRYFKKGLCQYIRKIMSYIGVTAIECAIMNIIRGNVFYDIKAHSLVLLCCFIGIVSMLSILIFYRTSEFSFMIKLIRNIMPKRSN